MSRSLSLLTLATLVISALLLGCEQSAGVMTQPTPTKVAPPVLSAEAAPAKSPNAISPEAVVLTMGNEELLAESLKKHRGKLVFVDYWATWCGPCVEFFPHTVQLHEKFGDKGLEVISVSFDNLDEEGKVRLFLADQGAKFENILSSYNGASVEAAEGFQFEGVLPHFRLYGRDGSLLAKWDGAPENIDAEIERLISGVDPVSPAAEAPSTETPTETAAPVASEQ